MTDLALRKDGACGRITLTRPQALNALSWDMCLRIEAALDRWRTDPQVALVLIEGEGPRAFCAGGDIAEVYHRARAGDVAHAQGFWRDEYRLNAKMAEYPKPLVSFLHGFVMGGGVGLGGHCAPRIVGETAQVAMPECGIGFVPDVGGSFLLARAPGRLGRHLALTAARMGPGDAIHAGFADVFVPEAGWEALKDALAHTGDVGLVAQAAEPPPPSPMAEAQARIDALYAGADVAAIAAALEQSEDPLAPAALKALRRNSPLSMAVTLAMLDALQAAPHDLRAALRQEYRVAHRILDQGDMLEGVRAAIIDKDRSPRWADAFGAVPQQKVAALLAPLGAEELALPAPDGGETE
ncbi:MAG TPA: enoyl-CoA hydratase [Citreicella sp.]|jgi:enoyl-CoA hydratase|nr:enoyl-CoA hydratase [Citreicella sp.]